MEPEPVGVKLEGSVGSEAETEKELMGRLEERAMRELLCWCMRDDICPTERVRSMSPESALHTRPEVRASRLVGSERCIRVRGWWVEVAQDGPDREGVLEILRAGLAQDVQG